MWKHCRKRGPFAATLATLAHMALATTATTGSTSPGDKSSIGYSVANLEQSIRETGDPNTKTYTAQLTVEHDNWEDFIGEMFGWSEMDGTLLHRILPEKCGLDDLAFAVRYDRDLSITYTGNNSSGWPEYEQLRYSVTYVVPLYDVLEDDEIESESERFCVWTKKPVAMQEKIPGGGFFFITSGKERLEEVSVRTGRVLELQCKWLEVPLFDYDRISSLSNCVNNAEITLDGVTYPEETVLFTGGSEEKRINAIGFRTRDITFSFLIRLDGRTWNKFWHKNGTYVEVSTNGEAGGDRPYVPADLSSLWTFS